MALDSTADYELYSRRSALKLQGRFAEAIPIQQQILEFAQQTGHVVDVSNAWNMLSHLFQQNGQLAEAEEAARHALTTYANGIQPQVETLATYEMKLAMILAEQRRYKEAVHFGELALEHFSPFHDPEDDFLKARASDVEMMKRHCDRLNDAAT